MRSAFNQHLMALHLAWRRLAAAPLGTLASLLAIGIALALPATGSLLLDNAARWLGTTNPLPQISLFMKLEAGRPDTLALASRLRSESDIASVEVVTREQTLARMSRAEGLGEVIDVLQRNPFPDALIITPSRTEPADMDALAARLRTAPAVEAVQLDAAWVRRLNALLGTGRLLVRILAVLFGIGLTAVSFGTLRLQILAHADEIEVSRLLGANDAFIRRPFHYLGLLQGLLGGILGWLIVCLVAVLLRDPLAALAAEYGMHFLLSLPGLRETAVLLGIAGTLGWTGAALSVGQHLRQHK